MRTVKCGNSKRYAPYLCRALVATILEDQLPGQGMVLCYGVVLRGQPRQRTGVLPRLAVVHTPTSQHAARHPCTTSRHTRQRLGVIMKCARLSKPRPPLLGQPGSPPCPHHDVRVVAALPQLGGVLDVRHHQRGLHGKRDARSSWAPSCKPQNDLMLPAKLLTAASSLAAATLIFTQQAAESNRHAGSPLHRYRPLRRPAPPRRRTWAGRCGEAPCAAPAATAPSTRRPAAAPPPPRCPPSPPRCPSRAPAHRSCAHRQGRAGGTLSQTVQRVARPSTKRHF